MRTLAQSVLCALALILSACTPPQRAAGPATATPQALPAATATSPVPASGIEGPLLAGNRLLTKGVVATDSSLRYGLLAPGLARSGDEGRTWEQVSSVSIPLPLVSPGDPNTLYAGDMRSCYKDEEEPLFYRSRDGGQTWEELAGGRGIRPVAVVFGGEADTLYGISCAGVSVSTDSGETWNLTGRTLDADITSILPVTGDGLRLLAVMTSEGGASHLAWFDSQGRLEQDLTQGFLFWGAGALAQAGSTLYLGNATGVWRLDETTGNWERFSAGLEDVVLEYDPYEKGLTEEDAARGFGLLALAADPYNPRRLAVGTVRGLYLSEDGGEQWQPVEGEPLTGERVSQVVWEPAAQGRLYATTPSGVYVLQLP